MARRHAAGEYVANVAGEVVYDGGSELSCGVSANAFPETEVAHLEPNFIGHVAVS